MKNALNMCELIIKKVVNKIAFSSVVLQFQSAVACVILYSITSLTVSPAAYAYVANEANEIARIPAAKSRVRIRANQDKSQPTLSSFRYSVEGFRVEGHPQISNDEISSVLEPWKGKKLNFSEFEVVVHTVATYLRENGHPDAQVSVSRPVIKDGTLAIAVQGLKPIDTQPRLYVKKFDFKGLTLLDDNEINELMSNFIDKDITLNELQGAADSVTTALRNKGYLVAQAFVPAQKIEDGIVNVVVNEGIVDGESGNAGVTVSGANKRIKPATVEKYLARSIEPNAPLNIAKLEKAIRQVKNLTGVKSARANLKPGSEEGTTQVEAIIEEGNLISGSLWGDNYGTNFTGNERANALLNLNSPSGHGERLTLYGGKSSGMDSASAALTVPVGYKGATLGASASYMELDIGANITPLNLDGRETIFSFNGSYPIITGGYDNKRFKNDAGGFKVDDRKVQLASLSLTGDFVDPWQGKVDWSTVVNVGDVDLSAGPGFAEIDAVTTETAGSFAKFNWNISRLVALGDNKKWSLYASLRGQVASKNLDSAEKFQLGGPYGVRAYPIGEGLGDEGWIANVEIRRYLGNVILGDASIYGFADVGGIKQFDNLWSNDALAIGQPNKYELKGVGMGLSITRNDSGGINLVWAKKIGRNPNKTINDTDADAENNESRIWVVGNISF